MFYAFDILWLDGRDLRDKPLLERKRILERVAGGQLRILITQHVEGQGTALFRVVCENDLEGIVAKWKNGAYTWNFSPDVSAYSMDVVWFGYPADFEIFATYGGITEQSTEYGILYLTLAGTYAGSSAQMEFGGDALFLLTLEFESAHGRVPTFPGLTFTSLTGPPAAVPEPGTVVLTALGLIGLLSMLAWISRNYRPRRVSR